jgi:glucoside 3-dehydrogenase (cytochrome c) hitch-hiker subunit
MERRELIQWLVATAGAGLPSLAFGRQVHRRPLRRSLSAHVERTLAVATERILPGAAEANVAAFIDKMLADWHTPAERERFLAGLPQLDIRCRTRWGRDFVDCLEADQVAVVTAFDDEVSALRADRGGAAANQHWFAMLKYLTVYGWCTSEAGMRALDLYPMAGRYDGCAPV